MASEKILWIIEKTNKITMRMICLYYYDIIMKKPLILISMLAIAWISVAQAWYYRVYDSNIEKYLVYTDELKFSPEYVNAYNYAYNNWITTADSIKNANMTGEITRIEMSKMISTYAMNMLWLKPDLNKNCKFSDITTELDTKYKYWVTRSCQLGLMWLDWSWNRQELFKPRDNVTRAQLATVLSRVLNRWYWRTIKNWNPYYDSHLKYLISEWIIKDYYKPAPDSKEKRWNVMVMLYRSDHRNIVTTTYEKWYTILKPGQTYRNKTYGFQIVSSAHSWWVVSIYKDDYSWRTYVTLYSYIPEEIDWYKLSNDYWEINQYKENAKLFDTKWLLLNVTTREILKKWTNNYNELWLWSELDDKLTETDYYLNLNPWYDIQESAYNIELSKDYAMCPTCWAMWYFINYEFKNLKWDKIY